MENVINLCKKYVGLVVFNCTIKKLKIAWFRILKSIFSYSRNTNAIMQSSLPGLILLRVFQTHPCDNPPENYVIRKARITHNCLMAFSRSLVSRIKENKTKVWFNLYGVWILDKISLSYCHKPHFAVKYEKVLNKTEALRKSNIPRSITFSDKSVPFCHTLHVHKDQNKK